MKDIYKILETYGIAIPEDKKETFNKDFLENYKTIAEVEGIRTKLSNLETERDTLKSKYDEDVSKRNSDLAALKEQLKEAGSDKEKLESLNNKFVTLQDTYNNAKADYEKQLIAQRKEFMIKEKANTYNFTSKAAKKDFISSAIAKDLPMENDNILGFDDFVNSYKEQDAEAFVSVEPEVEVKPTPQFSSKILGVVDTTPKTQEKKLPLIW